MEAIAQVPIKGFGFPFLMSSIFLQSVSWVMMLSTALCQLIVGGISSRRGVISVVWINLTCKKTATNLGIITTNLFNSSLK